MGKPTGPLFSLFDNRSNLRGRRQQAPRACARRRLSCECAARLRVPAAVLVIGAGLRPSAFVSFFLPYFFDAEKSSRIRGRNGSAAACKAAARAAGVEVRVLPDASRGRKLNVKLADSNPAFLGSNPGAPANPKKGMRDEGGGMKVSRAA